MERTKKGIPVVKVPKKLSSGMDPQAFIAADMQIGGYDGMTLREMQEAIRTLQTSTDQFWNIKEHGDLAARITQVECDLLEKIEDQDAKIGRLKRRIDKLEKLYLPERFGETQ